MIYDFWALYSRLPPNWNIAAFTSFDGCKRDEIEAVFAGKFMPKDYFY